MFEPAIAKENREALNQISQEAFANPFAMMGNRVKNLLAEVVTNINNIKHKNDESNVISSLRPTTREREELIKKIPYVDMRKVNVLCPNGFTGDYVSYALFLNNHLKLMQNFNKEVLVPTHNLILKYIGKPETLTSINNKDFDAIRFHFKEIEEFKKKMNHFFNVKLNNQTLPYAKLIKNQNEYIQLVKLLQADTIPAYNKLYEERQKTEKLYKDLTKTIDLLMLRIEQKPNVYVINQLNAERLSNMLNEVAVELEFIAALQDYTEQLFIGVINLDRLINSYLDQNQKQ